MLVLSLGVLLGFWPVDGRAQQSDRPTIQQRFATKSGRMFAHAMLTTQIRNDFYDSIGLGIDAGWYPSELLGLEARWAYLFSSLSPAAVDVKEETGLTPDARPQHMLMTAGARWSFGYGKMLVMEDSVVHFDPQLTAHGGIALAEKRVLPTATVGVSLLTHFVGGLQAKLDLAMAMQFEQRNRGWVPSFGFMPTLGFGWGGTLQDLTDIGSEKEGEG
ncbi:MAG: hypothetical protein ABEN55_04410 [Bradymonadaceae bacterium]